MRSFGLIAVVVLIVADAGDDAAKKDLEKFQGNWQLISMERDGKKTPQEDAKKITLTIQGNKFVLRKDAVIVSEDEKRAYLGGKAVTVLKGEVVG
jgi:uncharacterized protein (TIGR03067 family)